MVPSLRSLHALLPALIACSAGGCLELFSSSVPTSDPDPSPPLPCDATAGAGGQGGAAQGGGGSAEADGDAGEGPPACAGAWKGDLQLGTPLHDEITALIIDRDDNLYVTGYERGGFASTNLVPNGNARMVAARFDPSGRQAWKQVWDTPGAESGESLVLHPRSDEGADGKLVVAGRTTGSFPGFANQGSFDLVIAEVSTSGEALTLHQAGNERPQHPRQVVVDPDGAVFVAGYDDIHAPISAVYDFENGTLVRADVDASSDALATTWWRQSTAPDPDLLTSVAVAPGGFHHVYVGGALMGGTGRGAFVQKLARKPDGGVMEDWRRVLSPIAVDAVNAVAMAPDGSLYVTGATFLTLGERTFGQQDVFLARLDPATGATLWIAQYGTSESDWPTSMAFDAQGNVYVAGLTYGAFPGHQHRGGEDMFVLRFDTQHTMIAPPAVWQAGSPEEDHVAGVAVDGCGNVFVAGYTNGHLVPGQPNLGGRDMVLLQVPNFKAWPPEPSTVP
ncbi:SBBP repeat-containing protein [Chondromyces crocatus]|uniref:Uncharacterized protein n=1 Tax=Chondromyces crocatus TaxID=52 RepID=A0A0K1E9S6_CHOCO|nr:SBBP repeat-containing protein [Chondromyces crocatus]AKT37615.1 uncharacterized protein CMC5_017560 [Chondromyces crocatus]